MNGAQLVYLRDLSDVPPDTQMELRNFALQHMYPSMAAHVAASMMLGDMRNIIEQLPYEELLMQWSEAEAQILYDFFKCSVKGYDDDPDSIDFYDGYIINDFGQLDDLASRCHMMLGVLNSSKQHMDPEEWSTYVIREAINQQLPVPYEMLNQIDFAEYEVFLRRTIDAVKPIIKLDRLYPDPIAFRLMW